MLAQVRQTVKPLGQKSVLNAHRRSRSLRHGVRSVSDASSVSAAEVSKVAEPLVETSAPEKATKVKQAPTDNQPIRVATKSQVSSVAGAIAGRLRLFPQIHVTASGRATLPAVKGLATGTRFLNQEFSFVAHPLTTSPYSMEVDIFRLPLTEMPEPSTIIDLEKGTRVAQVVPALQEAMENSKAVVVRSLPFLSVSAARAIALINEKSNDSDLVFSPRWVAMAEGDSTVNLVELLVLKCPKGEPTKVIL